MSTVEAIPHRPEEDSFQVGASLRALRHALVTHWAVVIATTLLTTGLVASYMWVWPPVFQVSVLIAATSEKDASRSSFYSGWNVFRQELLADEGAMLTSGPVLKETIRRLDLRYDDVYHPFLSYLTHLWSKSAVGNAYRKVKYWIFPRTPGPYDPTPEQIEAFKVFSDFRDGVSIEQVKEASMGLLTVKGSSQRVAEIANTMAETYLDLRRERQIGEAKQAQESLAQEVAKIHQELARLDKDVAKFRRDNSLLLQYEKDKVQIGNFESRRLAVGQLEANIAEKEEALRSVERNLALEGAFINSARVFKDTAAQERLAKLESQLAQARQLFQPGSREVRELEEEIRIAMADVERNNASGVVRNAARVSDSYEVLRARKVTLESQLAGDRASLRKKKEELERERVLLQSLPDKLKVNHEFERLQAVTEGKLHSLYEKLAMATVSLAAARSAPPALRIVERAVPPEQPVWPKGKVIIPAAIFFGLLLGTMAALLLELAFVRVTRHRLRDNDAVYRVFAVVGRDESFVKSLYSGGPRPQAGRA